MPIINSFSILSFFLFFMGMPMSDINAENIKSQNLVMEVTQNSEITDPSENPPIGKVVIKPVSYTHLTLPTNREV